MVDSRENLPPSNGGVQGNSLPRDRDHGGTVLLPLETSDNPPPPPVPPLFWFAYYNAKQFVLDYNYDDALNSCYFSIGFPYSAK